MANFGKNGLPHDSAVRLPNNDGLELFCAS
ncbi:hypothetical protein BHMPCIPO_06468 [Ensifer sesbaniae]|nr:hypothetical protein [Ensifer sesbaniae]